MKHKATYAKIRKLIDERERSDANLDLAEDGLIALIEKDGTCDWAYGLLSEVYYWRGEVAPAREKLGLFEKGVEFGERGVELEENSLESNFWLAVNYGLYGTEKGVLKSLELIKPIQACLERALDVDESYFYGGPWRAMGRLLNKVPGWPISIGDNKKAIECLETALEFGPTFYLNHLYIAEAFTSVRDKKKARAHLEWIVDAPLSKHHEREDEGYKKEARALLKKL